MKLHFAPLQGYADNIYLREHARVYGGLDACYTPFIRVEKGEPRHQDMKRLAEAQADGLDIVPQIIFRSVEEFDLLSDAVKSLGCTRIDLNLGCPYPMQTGRGRGSAMIADVSALRDVAQRIADDASTSYSVKMRLGYADAGEWRGAIGVLNGVRLSHVTVHPRIARQMYDGELDMAGFDEILGCSANPVVFNGGITSVADIECYAAKYPMLKGLMIGRGLLARPSLAQEWRDGREWSRDERMDRLMAFHANLLAAYEQRMCGEAQVLQKIKPFWEYLEPEVGRKTCKAIRKATTLAKYRAALP